MAKNTRISQLRAEAKRLERNATRKMSRLRHSSQPVELTGSKYDYRKGAKSIDSMRSRDLAVHIKRLEGFNNRRSRFMPTAEGIAGPDTVNRYQAALRKINKKRDSMLQKFGDRKVASGVETYKERFNMREPAQRKMVNPSVNNPFRQVEMDGVRFQTPDAINKMADKFLNEARPEFDAERTKANRQTLDKMLDVVDHEELRNIVGTLTDEQFDLMWFDPDFMAGEGWLYAQAMGKIKGETKMSAKQAQAFEDPVETEKELALGIAKHAAQQ